MMKQRVWLENEDGSVLVVALMILVLLTLLGISITTTSEVEIQVAGNERRYKQNLYNAEAGAMEGAENLDEAASLDPSPFTWLHALGTVTLDDVRDDSFWATAGNSQLSSVDANTRYLAVDEGVPEGESMSMKKTKMRAYSIYGRCYNSARPNQGRSIVKVGYRRPY